VGTIRTIDFFGSVIHDTTLGFAYAIVGPAGTLAGSPDWAGGLPRWTQRLPLQLGGLPLSLAASPTPGTVDRVRSSLPLLVLLMGLVVSGLVPISVLFAQQSLRNAREAERRRITAALDRTTDGIWEWDLLTGASAHSPGIWRYLGYDPNTVRPKRDAWLALVHPEDYPRLVREITEHLTGGRPSFDAEYRVLARDGTWHTIVDRGRVVDRTPNGQPARMVGIKADVTVARSAQQAREAAEQRFREIFDSGFQYQLLLDQAATVVEVNQHALDQCSVTRDQVRGRPVWETLWWAGNAEARDRLQAATSDALRGLTRRYEDQVRGSGVTSVHLEIAIKPLTGDSKAPTQLLLEARDLTARRRAEATLREVETLTTMGRVAAQVAHEINNPLAGIQNSFLLIKGAIPTSHPHYAYVGAIEREITRIAAVTRQLYETYRPEQEPSEGAAVATVLGDAVAFLEQVNRPSGVRVQMELGQGPSVLPLPTALLRQIAYNLVQNAIEASPPSGLVVVRTTASDRLFELRVRDRGPGVSPEARERIFEPFFSTKSGRLRTGGMGLGLALVRRTVTAAGGNIAVEDVDGGGCDFVVTLPLATSEEGS
jgi:PAS domain S-box-containing protein